MLFNIREYLEERLAGVRPVASRSGNEVTSSCPSCEEWGCFYANTESGAHVCFKCDFRGRSAVGLVAQLEGISWSEARTFIFRRSVQPRRKAGLFSLTDRIRSLRPHAVSDDDEESEHDIELPKQFRPCYKDGKWSLPYYLNDRGIRADTARAWGLGYCRTGRYAGRLVIPIECPNGRSFTARDMTGEQSPKYLNPPGAEHSRLLIGWHMAPAVGDLTIVEGPLDAVKMWQHDVPAVALGGKEIHDEQRDMLARLPPDTAVTVMLDPEESVAPHVVASRLAFHFTSIHIAKLPDGVDPGASTRKQAHQALDSAARWSGDRVARIKGVLAKARNAL